MDDVETPIERPDVIVPDTGPLIHLAQADALHLLHQIGGRVVVADMVAFEATQDMTKPGAQEIATWCNCRPQRRRVMATSMISVFIRWSALAPGTGSISRTPRR